MRFVKEFSCICKAPTKQSDPPIWGKYFTGGKFWKVLCSWIRFNHCPYAWFVPEFFEIWFCLKKQQFYCDFYLKRIRTSTVFNWNFFFIFYIKNCFILLHENLIKIFTFLCGTKSLIFPTVLGIFRGKGENEIFGGRLKEDLQTQMVEYVSLRPQISKD